MNKTLAATLLTLALTSVPAHATIIEYQLHNLGGNSYEYVYNVINDTLLADIEEFTIYFSNSATNLAVGNTPAGWDPLVIQQDPGLPDSGFYDALADFGTFIAPGGALAGFSVTFDWNDPVTGPGAQLFEIVDLVTFGALDDGFTVPAQVTSSVPEPGTLALVALGLAALMRRKPFFTFSP